MRVLHVTPSFARRDGGPSETLRGLVPELERMGVDVHTLTTDKGVDISDRDFIDAGNVTVVRARRPASWNFAPGMVAPLWNNVREYDVLHIHSVNSFTTTVAMAIARFRKVPYLLEPHGAFDDYHMSEGRTKKRLYNGIIDRYGLSGLSGVLTSSKRERLAAEAVTSAPQFDLPLGVDEALFAIDSHRPSPERLLFLGRIAKKKRLDLILRALADPCLAELELELELVVAGPVGDDLDYDPYALAEELGVANRVKFLGAVNSETRAELLASAGIFVLASEDESFGVAVAEALAAGCAVIASNEVGIASDAASDGALHLTKLDAVDLASHIHLLLSQPCVAEEIGARGREYARGRYRWSASAEAAAQAYGAVGRS